MTSLVLVSLCTSLTFLLLYYHYHEIILQYPSNFPCSKLGSAHITHFQAGSIPAQKCKKHFGDNNNRSEGGDNKKCRGKGVPTIPNQIAKRQLAFIGKVVCNSYQQLPTKPLTAWCNHKQKRGGVLHSNKNSIVHNIALILPCIGGEYRPFQFHDEDVNGSCADCGLGELPKFDIRYFQYPLSNA